MLGRAKGTAATICTLKAHSWIVRLAAMGIAILVVSPVLKSTKGMSGTAGLVIVFLLGLGLLIPVALLVWDHQRGVHVREDGIRSVGANGGRFFAWSDIDRFEIHPHIGGTIAILQ